MNRRTFLIRSASLTLGGLVMTSLPSWVQQAIADNTLSFDSELYKKFRCPDAVDRPFVRWWWNGNKVEKGELERELQLMNTAGIGGVEINPVKFPEEADDLEKKTVTWLSDEWIDLLKAATDEVKRLGMVADLIVGSGWPFGGEYLQGDELGQFMGIAVKKFQGPATLTVPASEMLEASIPDVNNPYDGRQMELLSLKLVPDPMNSLDQVVDLSEQIGREQFTVDVPAGKYALYAQVKIAAFMTVINGVPGATGPTVNHFSKEAVLKYLDRMGDRIESRIGPLKNHFRAFFIDGLELEGANWTGDMQEEFIRRRGYDPMPVLPFTMYKVGGMGNVRDFHYGVEFGPEMLDRVQRVRYDFALTQAELLQERFFVAFREWCHRHGILARVQAYGRGTFPLNSSLACDIPEGESWTMNWLKHRLGEEMPNDDYRRGRGYTMINKFVSSGAHLAGKRVISAEEMTNTYNVFGATLEFLKLGSDQSTMSGITHPVFHGFNYSPPEAPFPGWIRYGAYYNENNNWWPYMRHFTDYKSRLSTVLHRADMYSDIAILPPVADMWSVSGMENEPFPEQLHVPYTSLVWEAMMKNGHGCDYISDETLRHAEIGKGRMILGPKQYRYLFLVANERMHPNGLRKVVEFVRQGGTVFCVEKTPRLSLGWDNHAEKDAEIQQMTAELLTYRDRFIVLDVPADYDFMGWFADLHQQYGLQPYMTIHKPDPYLMQNRYQGDNDEEIFFFANTHRFKDYRGLIRFDGVVTEGKHPWVWDLMTGKRYRAGLDADHGMTLDMGPAESLMLIFDRVSEGETWQPLPYSGIHTVELSGWEVELIHKQEGWKKTIEMNRLKDLTETEYINFSGTAIYRNQFTLEIVPDSYYLNLGQVSGIAELCINGQDCGVRWCGRKVYDVRPYLQSGRNTVEIHVTTVMANYMRTLTDNATAQKWTAGRKEQGDLSLGLIGPVTRYTVE